MNRTIPCLLLTLCLLLLSAAALATSDPSKFEFDITEGDITIADGDTAGMVKVTYGSPQTTTAQFDPQEHVITVWGNSPTNSPQLSINTTVPVKISYQVTIESIYNLITISIDDNTDVTLYLDQGSCDACGTTEQAGITLGSGSKLTIDTAELDRELRIHCGPSAILGPDSNETPATIILNSGTVAINPTCINGIKGNVNLVINGGTFIANGTTINVQNLIVTGGELWAGRNDSTKVTYKGLTENQGSYQNILCTAGILPYSEQYYDSELVVFGELTLPVDLTIPDGKTLYLKSSYGSSLTIPKDTSLTCNRLFINEGTTLTNNGTLTINGDSKLLGEMTNNGTLCINSSLSMAQEDKLGILTNTGTIIGSGSIDPKLNQDKPSLTVDSIENGTVTTVTLKADGQGKTALEYSADGKSWQDSPVFEGVDLSAGCTFTAHYKGDGHFYAESDPASVSIYPVSLDANGGTIASGKDVGYYITNQSTPLPAGEYVTRTGYDFAGWYANESCTGDSVTEIDTDVPGAKKYWAKWTAKTYMVKLHPNGGTIIGDDLTGYTYGVGATLPDADRTGYVFAGWFDSAALTGSPVVAISETSADNLEFWAGWIARPVITSPTENRTVTVYEGEPATMTITAENAVAYQWFMSTDGGNNWTACGENSPAYTTSPTKMEHSGYQYKCVVTGSPEPKGAEDKEELPPEELPPEGAQMSLRSRATDDGLAGLMEESPIFTLEVIRKDAIPQTGDSSRMGLWLALAGGCVLALACIGLRRGKRA